jgi:heme-degrading monooxygenase HmoA
MWVRLTYVKVDPTHADEVRDLYNGDEISGVIRQQKGYRFHHLLESVDAQGESISLTAWDSQEDAEAYEQSGTYKELVDKIRNYITAPPELRSYEVRE